MKTVRKDNDANVKPFKHEFSSCRLDEINIGTYEGFPADWFYEAVDYLRDEFSTDSCTADFRGVTVHAHFPI